MTGMKDNPWKRLEEGIHKGKDGKYILRLFVAGFSPRSQKAIDNIREICGKYLEGRYELSVIDIYQHPELAREKQIVAAPTLVKELPLPLRKFIGDLSDRDNILVGLEIKRGDGHGYENK